MSLVSTATDTGLSASLRVGGESVTYSRRDLSSVVTGWPTDNGRDWRGEDGIEIEDRSAEIVLSTASLVSAGLFPPKLGDSITWGSDTLKAVARNGEQCWRYMTGTKAYITVSLSYVS